MSRITKLTDFLLWLKFLAEVYAQLNEGKHHANR